MVLAPRKTPRPAGAGPGASLGRLWLPLALAGLPPAEPVAAPMPGAFARLDQSGLPGDGEEVLAMVSAMATSW